MTKSAKPLPPLKNGVLSPKQRRLPHFVLGAKGEALAECFLRDKGYQIVETNVVFKTGEIDIVALDRRHNEIVFVEVKTRQSALFGHPSQAVTFQKLRSLRRAARHYISLKGLRNCYRFDIISVTPEGVEHFENITWP